MPESDPARPSPSDPTSLRPKGRKEIDVPPLSSLLPFEEQLASMSPARLLKAKKFLRQMNLALEGRLFEDFTEDDPRAFAKRANATLRQLARAANDLAPEFLKAQIPRQKIPSRFKRYEKELGILLPFLALISPCPYPAKALELGEILRHLFPPR